MIDKIIDIVRRNKIKGHLSILGNTGEDLKNVVNIALDNIISSIRRLAVEERKRSFIEMPCAAPAKTNKYMQFAEKLKEVIEHQNCRVSLMDDIKMLWGAEQAYYRELIGSVNFEECKKVGSFIDIETSELDEAINVLKESKKESENDLYYGEDCGSGNDDLYNIGLMVGTLRTIIETIEILEALKETP